MFMGINVCICKPKPCLRGLIFMVTSGFLKKVNSAIIFAGTVKPVLKDHCHKRPPVLKDHKCFAESPTFQCKWTCYQRPPVLRDHIFMANCGGLSRQVPLYLKLLLKASWTKCAKQTPCKHWWIYSSQKVNANYVYFKFRVYLLFTMTLKLYDKLA